MEENFNTNNCNTPSKNGKYGVVSLLLIFFNAIVLFQLFTNLTERNERNEKLWEPDESTFLYGIPIYIIVSLILIWIVTPKATSMKKMFKKWTIGSIVLFIIYCFLIQFFIALGRAYQ